MACPVLAFAVPDRAAELTPELDDLLDPAAPIAPGKRTLTARLGQPLFQAIDPRQATAALTRRAAELLAASGGAAVAPPDPVAVARLAAALGAHGVALAPAELEVLARAYGDGVGLTERALAHASDPAATAAALRAHAHHHRATPLDAATRAAVEATTGRRLPEVAVTVDAEVARRGHLGEAHADHIRLAPEAGGDDALGRRVRLHEAAHVAQLAAHDRPAAAGVTVEHDAAAIAHAAGRGERRTVGVRADAAAPLPISAAEAAEAAADPVGYLRAHYPDLADLYDHGIDGLLTRAGDALGAQLPAVLAATGLDQLGPLISGVAASLAPEGLGFGVLTGCCECFESALTSLLASFDGFLAGAGPTKLQGWLAQLQSAESSALLDLLAGGFDAVRTYLAPILVPLADGAAEVGDYLWKEWVCYYAGLDPDLPPLEAIEQKLAAAWTTATAAFASAKAAVTALWQQLQQIPLIGFLARLGSDVTTLVLAIRKVVAARSRDPKVWLGILAKDLQGTMFEGLIAGLESGRQTASEFATSVDQFFRTILRDTGVLAAWNTTVPYLVQAGQAVQGFFTAIEADLAAIQTTFHDALTTVADALAKLYAAVKPLLDFVIGFQLAIATAPGGLVLFVAGQTFRHLPTCYQAALVDFALDLFIHAVEWIPATWPPTVLIRGAALGYLRTLKAAPVEQKVGAMTTIMRFVSGDLELVAGFVVGFFEGVDASTLGMVLHQCLPLVDLIPQLVQFAGELAALAATPFETLYATAKWFADLAASAQPIAGPDESPKAEEPAAPAEPAPAEPTPDEPGGFDPLPPFPGFPFDLKAAFDEVLRGDGVTRADLEQFLAQVNVQLAALGEQIGGQVATKVLEALNDDSAPYRLGELVGMVAGWACGELVVAAATMGVGSLVGAGLEGGELLATLAKNFPKVVELLKKLRAFVQPVIDFVEKLIAEARLALRALLQWVDDLILWFEKQLAKIVAWLEKKLGKKALRPDGGDDEGEDEGDVARAAAKAAWKYLTKHLDQDALHERSAVEAKLRASGEDGADGVKVKLGIDVSGDSWQVSADATGTLAKTYGDGWVARGWANGGETSEEFFGFEDESDEDQDILDDAARDLLAADLGGADGDGAYAALRSYLDKTVRAAVERRVELDGIEFSFELEAEADVEADGEATVTLVLAPNATKKTVVVPIAVDEDKALQLAKKAFGDKRFTTRYLVEVLGDRGMSVTMKQAQAWTQRWQDETPAFRIYKCVSSIEYSFDQEEAQRVEIKDTESSRSKYGYTNPGQTTTTGSAILNKGLVTGTPPAPDPAARFDSVVPGSAYKNFPRVQDGKTIAVLGHKYRAVYNWNDGEGSDKPGHMKPKDQNLAWNQDANNYRGPEHYKESSEEGGELRRAGIGYMIPCESAGSHESWWKI